jgi:hypothetical protein
MANGRTDSLMTMPERKKTKDISEVKKPKAEKAKKEKKPKISLDNVRRIYRIAVDDILPDYDDISDEAERKKLIAAIKKVLK